MTPRASGLWKLGTSRSLPILDGDDLEQAIEEAADRITGG